MKLAIVLAILLILIGGCSIVQDGRSALIQNDFALVQTVSSNDDQAVNSSQDSPSGPTIKTAHTISGTKDLALNEQDLQQLGITSDGTDCRTEEYTTNDYSPLAQYSICSYTINSLNDSRVVLELKKYINFEDLNDTYQYESLHLRGFQGLISENDYGDLSRFYVNNESTVYYYHLWISKNEYLIHITSKGTKKDGEYIAKIGRRILSKFG